MTDLIQKLRDATSGSRELDQAVWCLVDDRHKPVGRDQYTFDDGHVRWRGFKPVPPVTTSLDAIIGLIEEKLPGSSVLTAMSPNKTVCDIHEKPLGQVGKWHGHADHADKVLALCIALLSALEGES